MSKKSIEQVVAEEMNKVMMYGMNEDGELSEPDEQIDLDMTDKNLAKEIAKRAKEDLRLDDKDSFSKDAWAYFKENGLLPDSEDAEEEPAEDEPEEKEEPKAKAKSKKEEKKPAKASKKEEDAPKKSKRDDDKSRAPREKGPSFEDIACQIVKKTPPKDTYEALTEKFTELYEARGKGDDKEFIRKRVGIYYRIAATRLSVEMVVPNSKKAEAPKKASKKDDAPKKSKRDDD